MPSRPYGAHATSAPNHHIGEPLPEPCRWSRASLATPRPNPTHLPPSLPPSLLPSPLPLPPSRAGRAELSREFRARSLSGAWRGGAGGHGALQLQEDHGGSICQGTAALLRSFPGPCPQCPPHRAVSPVPPARRLPKHHAALLPLPRCRRGFHLSPSRGSRGLALGCCCCARRPVPCAVPGGSCQRSPRLPFSLRRCRGHPHKNPSFFQTCVIPKLIAVFCVKIKFPAGRRKGF